MQKVNAILMQFLMQRQSVFKCKEVVKDKMVSEKVLKIVVLRGDKCAEVVI